MGAPMTYGRVISRNHLGGADGRHPLTGAPLGAAGDPSARAVSSIAGDLWRLEEDSRSPLVLRAYALVAGVTVGQTRLVLDAFFGDTPEIRCQLDAARAAVYRQDGLLPAEPTEG